MASDLTAIREAFVRQNELLLRLVEALAPRDPDSDAEEVARTTGVDHLDPIEAALAYDYVVRIRQDTGHTPDDDEILAHLADEKTHDLHLRLLQREEDLTRIERERLARGPR